MLSVVLLYWRHSPAFTFHVLSLYTFCINSIIYWCCFLLSNRCCLFSCFLWRPRLFPHQTSFISVASSKRTVKRSIKRNQIMAEENKETKEEKKPEATEPKTTEEETAPVAAGSPSKGCKSKKLPLKLPSVSALRVAVPSRGVCRNGCQSIHEWLNNLCSIICPFTDLVRIRNFARLLWAKATTRLEETIISICNSNWILVPEKHRSKSVRQQHCMINNSYY